MILKLRYWIYSLGFGFSVAWAMDCLEPLMHGVEEITMPPYLLKEPIDYRIILAQSSEIRMSVRPGRRR